MGNNTKIIITKCDNEIKWYHNDVGSEFIVISPPESLTDVTANEIYVNHPDNGNGEYRYVDRSDCVFVGKGRITNNYGIGLGRDIEQLTNLRNIAKALNYEEGIVDDLNRLLQEAVELLKVRTEEIQ